MSKFLFTAENLKKYEKILSRYDDRESALLPVLHLAQEQAGYLPEEVMTYVSSLMDIPVMRIKEVVSFYDMFYSEPTARNVVQVCTNITCSLYGSREMYQELLKRYQTENMKPTEDGRLFFQKMECLGACEMAPCMRLNNQYVGNLTLDKALDAIRGLK